MQEESDGIIEGAGELVEESGDKLMQFIEQDWVQHLIYLLAAIIIIWLVAKFVKLGLNKTIVSQAKTKYRVRKTVNFIAYILVILAALIVYSDKLGNVGVALGVAGAGIAFALQEVIISFAGWLNIMIAGGVHVGQRVKIGDVKGDIIDIGMMKTTIMEVGDWVDGDLYNGCIVYIANSYIFREEVHNYSEDYPFLWDEIQVPIRTESNYKKAKQLFQQILEDITGDYAAASEAKWKELASRYRVEKARVNPMVTLSFDANWTTFTLRYIVDYKMRRGTKDLIFERILDELAQHKDVEIGTGTLEVTEFKGDDDDDPTNL